MIYRADIREVRGWSQECSERVRERERERERERDREWRIENRERFDQFLCLPGTRSALNVL